MHIVQSPWDFKKKKSKNWSPFFTTNLAIDYSSVGVISREVTIVTIVRIRPTYIISCPQCCIAN